MEHHITLPLDMDMEMEMADRSALGYKRLA